MILYGFDSRWHHIVSWWLEYNSKTIAWLSPWSVMQSAFQEEEVLHLAALIKWIPTPNISDFGLIFPSRAFFWIVTESKDVRASLIQLNVTWSSEVMSSKWHQESVIAYSELKGYHSSNNPDHIIAIVVVHRQWSAMTWKHCEISLSMRSKYMWY